MCPNERIIRAEESQPEIHSAQSVIIPLRNQAAQDLLDLGNPSDRLRLLGEDAEAIYATYCPRMCNERESEVKELTARVLRTATYEAFAQVANMAFMDSVVATMRSGDLFAGLPLDTAFYISDIITRQYDDPEHTCILLTAAWSLGTLQALVKRIENNSQHPYLPLWRKFEEIGFNDYYAPLPEDKRWREVTFQNIQSILAVLVGKEMSSYCPVIHGAAEDPEIALANLEPMTWPAANYGGVNQRIFPRPPGLLSDDEAVNRLPFAGFGEAFEEILRRGRPPVSGFCPGYPKFSWGGEQEHKIATDFFAGHGILLEDGEAFSVIETYLAFMQRAYDACRC